MEKDTVLVTAYTPAPRGTSMQELYKYAGVILEIDIHTDTIVDAELTLVTDLAKRFFKKILVGYDLKNGSEELSNIIRKRYWAPSDEAFIACLNVAIRRYFDTKSNLAERS